MAEGEAVYGGMDPLRTFDMDQEEWAEVVKATVSEGKQAWVEYVPTIIAAVEAGFLDDNLQMIAKWLRDRHFFLKNMGLAPGYATGIGTRAVGRAVVAVPVLEELAQSGTYDMMPPSGIRPTGKVDEVDVGPGLFTAKGWVFRKSAFIGKHFIAPALTVIPGGAFLRIDKVARTNFQVTVVAVGDEKQRGKINRSYNFGVERQSRWYNIPRDDQAA